MAAYQIQVSRAMISDLYQYLLWSSDVMWATYLLNANAFLSHGVATWFIEKISGFFQEYIQTIQSRVKSMVFGKSNKLTNSRCKFENTIIIVCYSKYLCWVFGLAIANRIISYAVTGSDDLAHFGYHVRSLSIDPTRSEERRVGKECRSRWSPYH